MSTKDSTIILAIIKRDSGTLIGTIGTFRPFELGFSLLPDYWGAGYATEAAKGFCIWHHQHCGVRTILTATVDLENGSSKRLLAKCGFAPVRDEFNEGPALDVKGREIWRETASS